MEQRGSGEIVAAWVPTCLADQVKEHAQAERRSVSSVVRHLIEDSFADSGEDPASGGWLGSSARRDADFDGGGDR